MDRNIDFAGIFDVSPIALMVLDRELRYVAANAEYLRATASRREDLIGKRLFDLFPNDPADPNNAPAQMLRRSLERALATGERDHLAVIEYVVPTEVDGVVRPERRYWSATHCPVRDGSGEVAFILQHTVDITALHSAEQAPSGDHARMQAGVLSRAEAVQQQNVRLDAERDHLRVLFEQAPGFMCVLEGKDHVFTLANAAYLRLVGHREVVGKRLDEALPEVIEQGFRDLLDQVLATGEPFIGQGVGVMLQRTPGAPLEEAFVDFVYQPVLGADGKPRGIFCQGHDVTARKRAEKATDEARRAAEAFSEELVEQSRSVKAALDRATARITELEAELVAKK